MYRKITLAIGLFAFSHSSSNAAEWVFDISAAPTFGYNDNVFLEEDEKATSTFSVTPTVELSRNTENISLLLRTGYAVERYFSESTIDSNNPFIDFEAGYQLERLQFGLKAEYKEDSSRNEALDNDGDFSSSDELRRRSITPSMVYQLSEIDSINAEVAFSEVDYASETDSDNETQSLTLGWQRQFTERFSGGVSGSVSKYEIEGITSSSDDDNYNLSLTANYQLSEIWTVNGRVGYRRLNSEMTDTLLNTTTDSSSTGLSYLIGSEYVDDRDRYSVDLSKDLSPSSSGQVNERERIAASWSRQLFERLSSTIAVSYQETDALSDSDGSKRKNLDFSPSLQWQLSSNMSLNFKYDYRQQKESGPSGEDVDSNSFSVNINYDWDGIRVSR